MRFLIFLLLVSTAARAQSDSLLPRILLIQNDTERINALYKRGFELRNHDPQTAFAYAKRSETAAQSSGSEKHLAKSYNLLGILYYKKGNYKTALHYHTQALQLRQHRGDITGMAFSQVNLGNVYADLNLPEQAEAAYLQAISAYRKTGQTEKIADCLLNIGTLKHQLKQYDAAIENYKLAEKLTGLNDYNSKAIFLTNMAEAYKEKGQLETCIAYNEDALKLRMMADNTVEIADNYLNLADAYILQNELLSAKAYLDTAWQIANRYDYFELSYEACNTYARYYAQARNFESAFYWQKKYNDIKDSLLTQQATARQVFDFNEINFSDNNKVAEAGIKNSWLLVFLFGLLVFIPLSLSRFKR